MADVSKKVEQNVPGRLFVDWTCIYCGLCVEIAPSIFAESSDPGWAYVKRQPATEAEWELARQAAAECPLDSIGIANEDENPHGGPAQTV